MPTVRADATGKEHRVYLREEPAMLPKKLSEEREDNKNE
jgi:hypothetical protein